MPKPVNEYYCEICKNRFHRFEDAEECETKHKGDLCFQNISSFKDVLDQLFLQLNFPERECVCSMSISYFFVAFPKRLKVFTCNVNLPYWISHREVMGDIRIDIDKLQKLVPLINKDFKEYETLQDDVERAQKFRDSDYWELNKKVRQLLKSNEEFKTLEKEIAKITARMSQIKSLIMTEQGKTASKENIEKYANLSKQLLQKRNDWRLK